MFFGKYEGRNKEDFYMRHFLNLHCPFLRLGVFQRFCIGRWIIACETARTSIFWDSVPS